VKKLPNNEVRFSLENFLPEIQDQLSEALGQGLLKGTILVRNEVLRLLSGQRSGKLYKVPGTRRTYRASQPGEPPASRLGHLRSSYVYRVLGTGHQAQGFVGSEVEYAHYLEYGTYKMAPRPHLIPAMRNSKPKIEKLFKRIIR
jgi:HK97 gp10 family phage protein